MSTKSSKKGTARPSKKAAATKKERHGIVDALAEMAHPIDELKHAAKNARVHPPQNLREIMGSMREFGQDVPIVVNRKTMEVLKGNGRLQAARELGWTHMAVVWVEDDEPRAVARALADNAAALSSEWDEEVLGELIGIAAADDADVRGMLGDLESAVGHDDVLDKIDQLAEPPEVEGLEVRPEEHYDFVLVMSENVHEWNRLCRLLGLEQPEVSRSGRMKIGVGRAVKAAKLLALLDGGENDG